MSPRGSERSTPPTRFWLGATLAMVMATGGFVRSAFPVLSTFVIDEYELTAAQFGLLLTAFMASLTVSAPLTGRVVDAIGGRQLLSVRFLVVAIGLAAASVAPSFPLLLVAVVGMALSLGGGNPGTNKLIASLLPAGDRGTIMGVKQSGGQLGVLVAGLALPLIAVATSWRVSLLAGILLPVIGMGLLHTHVPPDRSKRGRSTPGGPDRVLDTDVLWHVTAIGFAMGAGVAAVFGFLPLFAQERLGLSSAAAGGVVSLMAFVGVGARIAWGRYSERAEHYWRPFATLALLSLIATAAIAGSTRIGVWSLWVGAALAGLSLEAWNSVGNMAIVALIDLQHAGKASGLMMLGFLLGGAVSPFAFGLLIDFRGYGAGWSLVAVFFSTALAVTLWWRRSVLTEGRQVSEHSCAT